jgi:glutamyl-tRNA reductase
MPILALGVSYRRASVELLERLAFGEEDYPKAYRHLLDLEAVREGVILSTCNRVEVFAEVSSYHAGFLDLKRFLSESRSVPANEFAEPLYSHYEDDAAEHLFSVAAGIDSMVVGEPQILSQVRQAYRRAEGEGAVGPTLSALFRAAIRAGRRARTETAIEASPAAFVEAGARLADRALGGLAGRSAVVVGAGAMATLAVRHLRALGVGRIRVVNRSLERARALAARTGAEPAGLDALVPALRGADLVVASTGAVGTVVGVEAVREALAGPDGGRPGPSGRRLFVLDLAVPRDVDPEVAELPGVVLADIDDLQAELAHGNASAREEVERVRAIVAEEVRRFAEWRRAARLAPLIRALRARGDEVVAAELARAGPRLAGLDEEERAAVEAVARSVVAKLLHGPIAAIKRQGGGDALARTVAELFGVDFRPDR